jgi:hypothetical protein
LERVDFSTRSGLVTNLPRRARDVVLRPCPWQVQNTSQQLGAIGTLVVLAGLYLLSATSGAIADAVWRSRADPLSGAAPAHRLCAERGQRGDRFSLPYPPCPARFRGGRRAARTRATKHIDGR